MTNKPPTDFAAEALDNLDSVYRFAVRLTQGRVSDAEDLVQDTFLQAQRSWASYESRTNCRAWLFTICRNRFLRIASRDARMVELPDNEAAVEALAATAVFDEVQHADPEQIFFGSFLDEEVVRALDGLPVPFREIVVLSDLEGLSYTEAAEVLGLPVGTVKSRLFRGRRMLQEKLYAYAVEMGYIQPRERNDG
ncbi:MAG: sigma-70 family RNA polymerase sigma factor [Gemmatimonadaceae bacterium]|nr:sigma-70 family RNA polymerase sigma factor [Gemmatimonadaceae bacterium]